eukprot:CAMPEP_0183702524 /NCGR_PEP_ID=MMETSP0737-20130205/592_1 /TAXON_ID=385413 /ORGANISM="Thalassiosira miniscula, Strain CCMP1093" /LENGTH=1760 /DNA_ID=CAMNT_0025929141 /DNA_START=174 /DNA_END=5456 /DNA_ORIENTATION=-
MINCRDDDGAHIITPSLSTCRYCMNSDPLNHGSHPAEESGTNAAVAAVASPPTTSFCSNNNNCHRCRRRSYSRYLRYHSDRLMPLILLLCYSLGMLIMLCCSSSSTTMSADAASASLFKRKKKVTSSSSSAQNNNNNLDDTKDYVHDDDEVLEDLLLSDYDDSLDINGDYDADDSLDINGDYDADDADDDYDEEDDIREYPTQNQQQKQQPQQETNEDDSPKESNDAVLILSAVDGTLAGISRSTGQILWKQSNHPAVVLDNENDNTHSGGSSGEVAGGASSSSVHPSRNNPPEEFHKFLSPLVSTSTSKLLQNNNKNNNNNHHHHTHQWHAIPSIDGTVYLTSGSSNNEGDDETTDRTGDRHDLSTLTHIRTLVDRAPFVDAHQRFFVGSRRAMVAAVDERTGEILRVIPKWKRAAGSGGEGDEDEDNDDLPPSLEGRDVVWIGRLEHTVTVHDLLKGTVDVEFSVAEILSVDEMIHGHGSSQQQQQQQQQRQQHQRQRQESSDAIIARRSEADWEMERLFTDYITEALRHPSAGDRILRLPAPRKEDEDESSSPDNEEDDESNDDDENTQHSSINSVGLPFLVSTPGGNVAFRDDFENSSNSVGWVSFDLLHSPVVYAIEASSGRKIRVNMLPDDASVAASSASGGSVSSSKSNEDGLPLVALERQIASLEQQVLVPSSGSEMMEEVCGSDGECRAVQTTMGYGAQGGSVVGALQNGQIYALPLGDRISNGGLLTSSQMQNDFLLGLPQPPPHQSMASDMVNVNNAGNHEYHKKHHPSSPKLNTHHVIGFHDRDSSKGGKDVDVGDNQHVHLDNAKKQLASCTPSSPLYPGCLIGASLMLGNLLHVDGNLDMASVFASSDLDFDLYLDMLQEGKNNNRKKNQTLVQQLSKIMSSWLAPTVALLFVISFEMGRRERIKSDKSKKKGLGDANSESLEGNNSTKDNESSNEANANALANGQGSALRGGVIQLSDEILGYGGHGTIVYKGVLDKRQVAVKRLLAMYHASADREISLLIESDGHPNVVRYFLKEMRGEFVYLALELCDMSLNDLIVSLSKLRNIRKENFQLDGSAKDLEGATKSLLFQISSGVRHIHSLRIVHRDLKPQNILLALRNKKAKSLTTIKQESGSGSDTETELMDDTTHTTCSDTNSILESFKNQEYVPKISDMGLGKQLAGQSSFGLSTLGTGSVGANGAGAAGDAGAGAGSVGWQAPEVMAMRWSPESSSGINSNNETSSTELMEASPLESSGANITRTSRSVDIFSLGCIFYCTILPGSHPFGEWYEREANIMKNRPNKEDLDFVSPDASDLILSMIHRDARARPTAEEVCEHPFFWSLSQRLKFICELSDRLESCDMTTASPSTTSKPGSPKQGKNAEKDGDRSALNIFAIERGAVDIFGSSWEKKLDPELMEASLSRRTYDPSSVRDCLRMIRNKHHHYDELPSKLKSRIGSSTDGLSSYIARAFPRLLMHCYHFCVANLTPDDSLALNYKLPISRYLNLKKSSKNDQLKKPVIADLSPLDDNNKCPPLETIPDDDDDVVDQQNLEHVPEQDDADVLSSSSKVDEEAELPTTAMPTQLGEPQPPEVKSEEPAEVTPSKNDELSGIVVWAGSNTAKELNCRGWYRSDDEWIKSVDTKPRKRDPNLTRFMDDPKFRTRLCNHWDASQGMFCPMRKKNKCIFAHGPVELRVKEGKRHRWGTLVRKDGLCANPCASGGEDTYGAARSIEKTRKDQGQWTVDSKKQGKGKSKGGGKQTPKKKKSQT